MNKPPTRLPLLPPLPPTLAGREGRVIDQAMPLPTRKTIRHPLSILFTLALLPTGCFNPLVDLESDASSGGDATDAMTTSGSTEATTTSEPDSSSGDPLPVCGDAVVEGDEVCDDGVNDGSYGGCNADCSAPGPFCGDGAVNGEEPCDDGDDVDGNGCNVDCVVSGSEIWRITYDGPEHGSDSAAAVTVDSANNVIATGVTQVDGETSTWVAKYSPAGEEVWIRTYSSPGGDARGYDVGVLPNDDIIVVGSAYDGSDNQDAWIRRYSASGDTVWTQTHSGTTGDLDYAAVVVTDSSGNIYVAMVESQVTIGNGYVHLIRKYAAEDGQEFWTIYEPTGVEIDDMTILPSNSLIIAGKMGEPEFWAPMLEERNSDGGLEWQAISEDGAPGWYSAIDANASGEIALVHYEQETSDFRIIHLGPDRQEVWSEFPWGFESVTRGVVIDDLGWLSCAGGGGADATFWTRKYQPDGLIAWNDTYNGPEALFGLDQGEAINRDSAGNIISAGFVLDSEKTGIDARIQKFAP